MKKIIILACMLFLGGCTAKFAYNNANWLVYWYLDDYVELNNEQEDSFDSMLDNWMMWHRQEELPKYQRQLEDIIDDIKLNNINVKTIATHRERGRSHWHRIRSHVAPDLVTLGSTLTNQQVESLFSNLEKLNKEDEEELNETSELDEEEKIEKWTKRNQKGIKKWLGKISTEQKKLIASFYNRFKSTEQHWIDYKREYQRQLRDVFAREQRDEVFNQQLLTLIVAPEKFRLLSFQEIMDANQEASTEYMIGLLALISDKQRKHLIKEIEEFKDDAIRLQN